MKSPLSISLAVAAIAVVALWFASDSTDGPQPDSSEALSQGNPDVDGASSALREESAPRHAPDVVAPSPTSELQLDHPYAFVLHIRAIDEFGLPQGDRRVRIAPLGCTQNVMEQRTDDSGRAILEWKGREKAMRMGLALGRGPLREITVESGATRNVVGLALRDSGGLSFSIVSRGDGKNGFFMGGGGEQKLQLVASTESEDSVEKRAGLHPHGCFSDRLLDGVSAAASPKAIEGLPLVGRAFRSVLQRELQSREVAEVRAGGGTISGIVFGEDGKPAAQQLLALLGDSEAPLATARSDANGEYRFNDVRPGPLRIRAGGQRMGLAEQALHFGGGTTTANLHLRLGQRIEGKATDQDGKPLAGWIVEYEAHDGQWVDRALVRDDGAFTLPNLPGGAARLLLRENSNAVPTAIVASVLPDSGAVHFDLSGDAAPNGSISLRLPERGSRPTDAASDVAPQNALVGELTKAGQFEISFGGAKNSGSTIQLNGSSFRLSNVVSEGAAGPSAASACAWQVESGFCFSIPRAEDGSFTCTGLRAGYYRIEVRDIGVGAIDLGQYYVDGQGPLDLGLVQMPRPGLLQLIGRKPGQQIELYHRRLTCDVRAVHDLGERDEVELPSGTWILAYRTDEGPPKFREVVLRPGTETAFDLSMR